MHGVEITLAVFFLTPYALFAVFPKRISFFVCALHCRGEFGYKVLENENGRLLKMKKGDSNSAWNRVCDWSVFLTHNLFLYRFFCLLGRSSGRSDGEVRQLVGN